LTEGASATKGQKKYREGGNGVEIPIQGPRNCHRGPAKGNKDQIQTPKSETGRDSADVKKEKGTTNTKKIGARTRKRWRERYTPPAGQSLVRAKTRS